MIKSTLVKVCFITCYTFSPSFRQFINTTPVKIFAFCREPFCFISSYELKHCSVRCRQVVIGRSQVWWVSRMEYNFSAECFQHATDSFSICDGAQLFCCSFGILTFFQAVNCSNWLIVVVSPYKYEMWISDNRWLQVQLSAEWTLIQPV